MSLKVGETPWLSAGTKPEYQLPAVPQAPVFPCQTIGATDAQVEPTRTSSTCAFLMPVVARSRRKKKPTLALSTPVVVLTTSTPLTPPTVVSKLVSGAPQILVPPLLAAGLIQR